MADALKEASKAESLPQVGSVDVILDGRYLAPPPDKDGRTWVRTSVLVQASPNELYSLWHNIESAPMWQEEITDVIRTGPTTSHWVKRSDEKTIEWDAEVLADEPGKRIAWHSIAGDSDNAGEVVFEEAPGGRGTIVTVLQEFHEGKVKIAKESVFSRSPKQEVIENLRHFKAFAETGEIPRTEGQPHGPRGTIGKLKVSAYGESIATPPDKEHRES